MINVKKNPKCEKQVHEKLPKDESVKLQRIYETYVLPIYTNSDNENSKTEMLSKSLSSGMHSTVGGLLKNADSLTCYLTFFY